MTPEQLNAAKTRLAELDGSSNALRAKIHETTAAARSLNEQNRVLMAKLSDVRKEATELAATVKAADEAAATEAKATEEAKAE